MSEQQPDLYDFEQTMKALEIEEEELKRLISEGEIRAFRQGDELRIDAGDVERLRRLKHDSSIDEVEEGMALDEDALGDLVDSDGGEVIEFLEEDEVGGELELEDDVRSQDEVVASVAPSHAVFTGDRVGFGSDGSERSQDLLGFGPQVQRMATLLAARGGGAEPAAGAVGQSVAIGLFGNWGSGKSTFMRLLREQVRELSSGDGDHGSARRVAQIELNAWHFADANLWASIAAHLFDELADELARRLGVRQADGTPDTGTCRAQLRGDLASSKAAVEQAEARRKEARGRRNQLAAQLEEHRKTRKFKERDLFERLLSLHVKTKAGQENEKRLQTLVEAVGASDTLAPVSVIETADELRAVTVGLRAESRGWSSTWRQLSRLTMSTRPRVAVTAVVLGGAMILLGTDLGSLGLDVESLNLSEWATKGAGAVTSGLALLATARGKAKSAIDAAQALCEQLDAPVEVDDRVQQERTQLAADIAAEDRLIEEASAQIDAADEAIRTAEQELARIQSGGLVYDFLADADRQRTYREQLGLISLVRRDFEELSKLLDGWHEAHAESDADGLPVAADAGPPIDRIVLYVDDLDRCEPERVVEVLQAVHLLFDFPLFSVVVGVDPRWLERSLVECYGRSQGTDDVFDPKNYLEKIFQIPYSLERMDHEAFGQLIDGLAPPPPGPDGGEGGASGGSPGDDGRPAGTTPSGGADARPAEGDDSLGGSADEADGPVDESALVEAQDRRFEALHLSDAERSFAKALHAFVGTPREGKRFINVYRLLRVHAAEMSHGFGAFLQREHKAVLLMLALQVHHGTVGSRLLRMLADAHQADPDGEPTPLPAEDLPGLLATIEPTDDSHRRFHRQVERLFATTPDLPRELDPYLAWAAAVGRYSFAWHLRTEGLEGEA